MLVIAIASIYDNEAVLRKLKVVLDVIEGSKTNIQAAEEAGVNRNTIKNWVDRYKKDGLDGLFNKPRGKNKPLSDDAKKEIVEMKIENRTRSSRKIRDLLNRRSGIKVSRQAIWKILKRAGENRRVKKDFKVYRDFEREHPNSLWQIDIMDAIIVEGMGLVYLVLIIDDYSREIVGSGFFPNRSEYNVLQVLWKAIVENGIPIQIYSDRGTQFKSALGKGMTHFEKVCQRLGIGTIFGRPGIPEGRGKIERLFEFIQDDFLPEYRFAGLEDINQKFNDWRKWYNNEHEHSSLGGLPPSSRYRDFTQRMPEGDLFEIFSQHQIRHVRKNATISFKGKIYPVDPRFIKEKVEVHLFGNDIKIYGQSRLLAEYDASIDYYEKMLRCAYHRTVKKDGYVKFKKVMYKIGTDHAGERVEIVVVRDQLRAFLRANRLLVFKVGEGDALLVNLNA